MNSIAPRPAPSLPTGTVTFMLTDIEGSTRLWERYPEPMRQAMIRHDTLIESAVERYAGTVVRPRGEGDSRFAVFPRATDAVAAAGEIQRALFQEPWSLPSPLRIRIALHTGEADVREGDYYGTEVNRCARLRSAAHGGQTLLSQVTYALVHAAMPEGLTLRDLGEHRLKDLQEPEHVYQLVIPGVPSDFPPLVSLESFHHNLPAALTSFVGREREIDQVKQMLKATRLLTITGSGGAGKTRLALQVAYDLLDAYRDGVWLVELANLSDGNLIAQFVASTLGIREEPNRTPLQTLSEHLHSKELLHILYNCEHLIQPAAQLAESLLRGALTIRIVATSREPLRAAGETAWRIPSLSLPDLKGAGTLDQVTQYEAVKLFADRAVAVRPAFAVTPENAATIVQICARLDGIPLAIELAAARVRVLSVQEIAARLDDRFHLLVGLGRNALPRQQTLRALIDWSYDLLSETERTLLRRLSVFAGGWVLEAAEEICSSDGIEREQLLDMLSRLVDKSLVVAEMRPESERYHMLETIRQYAGQRLAESEEPDRVASRHFDYFAALARRSYGGLWGPAQGAWLSRLEEEHDNLRAALEWAGRDIRRAQQLLFMCATLWRFWEVRGHLSEGRAWLERALSLNPAPAETLNSQQIWYRANALRGAGALARQQGDYGPAIHLHEESLAMYQQLDDKLGIARELDALGEIARVQGDYDRAVELNTESLALRYEIGDKEGIAASLGNLGVVMHDRGEHKRARDLLEESLKLNRELGDQLLIGVALNNLGLVFQDACEYPRAIELYQEALELYRELSNRLGISFTLQNLGNVVKDQGDLKRANSIYDECLTLKRELGDRRGVARAIGGLAEVALMQGNYPRAIELANESMTLYRELGLRPGVALVSGLLAYLALFQGDYADAEFYGQQTLELAGAIGAQSRVAYARQILGVTASARENHTVAVEQLESSIAILRETGDRRNIAIALVNLARISYRRGDLSRSLSLLDEGLALSREIGDQWGTAFGLEVLALVERSRGNYARAWELVRSSLKLAEAQENRQGIANCLGAAAGLAFIAGQSAQAVRLFAAADKLRRAMGVAMSAPDRREYEDYLGRLRTSTPDEEFQAAWRAGCEMTLQEAIQLALR